MSIQESVLKNGFFVDYNFLSPEIIPNFDVFFTLPSNRPGVVEFKSQEIERSGNASLIQLSHMVRGLMITINKKLEFHKLWFQTTNKHSVASFEAKASPFLPHIDTQRYTKAMIYLSDVDELDGPFTTSQLNPNSFENLRQELHNKKAQSMNYQSEKIEFDPTKTNYFPITGKKGMLIVFDTNTPHFAGKMTSENVRKILRFDFWDKRHILK